MRFYPESQKKKNTVSVWRRKIDLLLARTKYLIPVCVSQVQTDEDLPKAASNFLNELRYSYGPSCKNGARFVFAGRSGWCIPGRGLGTRVPKRRPVRFASLTCCFLWKVLSRFLAEHVCSFARWGSGQRPPRVTSCSVEKIATCGLISEGKDVTSSCICCFWHWDTSGHCFLLTFNLTMRLNPIF